jgi:hypothetical protein
VDRSEEVIIAFVVAFGDGTIMLYFIEEPLNLVARLVHDDAKQWRLFAVRHRPDVRPDPAPDHVAAQGVTVVSTIGEQHIAVAQRAQHVVG